MQHFSELTKLYIGGEWQMGTDSIAVRDLAEGGTVAEMDAASSEQAEAALAAASEAQAAMRKTTPVERARWLEAIAAGLVAEAEAFTDIIVREAGKPIASGINREGIHASIDQMLRTKSTIL